MTCNQTSMKTKLLLTAYFIFFLPFTFVIATSDLEEFERSENIHEFNVIVKHYEEEIKKDPKNLKLILAVGDVYYSLREYPKAIEYYQRALILDPQNIKIKTPLALAYLNNNDLEKSHQLLEEVLKVDPNNPAVLGGLGRIEALKHHLAIAEILYQKVLEKNPRHFTTLYYLAELRIEQKRYYEAQDILRKLLQEDAKATWVRQSLQRAEIGPYLEESKILENKGDFSTAIKIFKEQLKKDPMNLEIYLAMGQLYTKMGNYNEAIAILNQGRKLYPNNQALNVALGFTYLAKKDLSTAQSLLEKQAQKGTERSEALAGLGRIAALKGETENAEKIYLQAIELNPIDTLPLSYLAQLKLDQKKYEEAIKIFEKILQINPTALWAKEAIEQAKVAPLMDAIRLEEKSHHFSRAEELYKQLISKNPHNMESYLSYGQFYEKQKNYQKAIEIYLQGQLLKPESEQLNVALGNAYLLNKELGKSYSSFLNALDQDPLNMEAFEGIGRLNDMIGNEMTASQVYEWALKINPYDITALSYLIDLRMEQKNYSEAQKLAETILRINPNAHWVKQVVFHAKFGPEIDHIKALEKKGQIQAAIEKYKKILDLSPESEDVYLGLGRLYLSLKNYSEAIKLYKLGLQHDPSSTQLRINLALTYLEMNDWKKAKPLLEIVYKNNSQNVEALAALGKIALLRGDKITAEKLYQKAYAIDPENLLVLSYLAEFWMKQAQYLKAEKAYEKIIQLDPLAAWAKSALEDAKNGPLLQKILETENKKNYKEAETLYLQLIKKNPTHEKYYLLLGELYVKLKRFQEAINLYQKALQFQPENLALENALAFAYLQKGDLEVGKSIFEKILKTDHLNADALTGLGFYEQLKGHANLAKEYYEAALKADPNNITALIYLAELSYKNKDFALAQKLYKKVSQLNPAADWVALAIEDSKHGRMILAIKDKEEAKDYKGADILWQQLLLEEPENSTYFLRAGLFYHRSKQYEKAIDTYLKGIHIDPHSADLYAALGLVYLSKKDYSEANNAFQRALKIDANNPDALAGLGNLAMQKGDFQQAEQLMQAALAVDPHRIAALSSLGDLWMKEKRYNEAEAIYEKLKQLRPKEKWIQLSLEDAKNGSTLDEIKQMVEANSLAEAAERYRELLQKYPENPRYYFGLGQMYMRLKEYGKSIETNLEGLEKNPDENELRVALGYAYFYNDDLSLSRQALEEAVRIDSKDPEGLAGLGQVNVLENNDCEAEELFKKALLVDPKNQSALSFYADLLMQQRRYPEAQNLFAKLWQILPNATWVQHAWQDAADGPVRDIANRLANEEEFELAAELYRKLIYSSPEDPVRYLSLGQMYINMQEYCRGIEVYETGLMIDPEAWYLWRALGLAYILLENFEASHSIFAGLVAIDPNDAESWAGLGRIQALNGSPCLAENYYAKALELSASNLNTLSFLADLKEDEQFNFSALNYYENIIALLKEGRVTRHEPLPKWARRGYHNVLDLTRPSLSIGGGYHEEDQWDPTLHRWSAMYLVYGGKAFLNFPIYDDLKMWGSAEDQYYQLIDQINRKNIYSFDVQRFYVGAKWVYNACFFVEAKAGLTNYSPDRRSNFNMMRGTIAEPSLVFTYHKPKEKATLGFLSGSDLVARNFSTNRAKLVGYYYLEGTYQRKIMRRGWVGFEAEAYWYDDFVNNNSQRVLGWFQWRPPFYPDNILFRYHCKYQTFAKNIPDYYTYKPQIVNQLQVTLEKYWRVCWAETFYTSLSYAHGWQDTHTRFAQIIVITPIAVRQPFIWDRRQYNLVFGNLIYRYDQLQITFGGDYYRDTKKYTIWSLVGDLRWRF